MQCIAVGRLGHERSTGPHGPHALSSSRKAPRHTASAPAFWNASRIGVSSRPNFGLAAGRSLVERADSVRLNIAFAAQRLARLREQMHQVGVAALVQAHAHAAQTGADQADDFEHAALEGWPFLGDMGQQLLGDDTIALCLVQALAYPSAFQ